MALYIKDAEVDQMAERLATLYQVSKTEAVRRALRRELERGQNTLVERGLAFTRELRALADQAAAEPVDRAFIDSLHGEP